MKKLLIATDGFLPRWDGIARYLSEIIPRLKEEYEIKVIAPSFPEFKDHHDRPKGYHIARIPTYKFRFGDYNPPSFQFKSMRKAVEEADIVWTHAVMPIGLLSIYYASKFKKPVIATIHSFEWELAINSLSRMNIFRKLAYLFAKKVARYLYNKCDLLMVPDKEVGEILSWQGIHTMKRIVHLGTDTKRFHPPEDKQKAKERLGLDPHLPVIGYCGRIGREKNLMTLIKAFKQLRYDDMDCKLLIVGKGVKDEIMNHDDIVVAGPQDDVVPYLQAMDIYVLPSLTETTSLSTMEAMSCGCAVVVTRVGYVKQYVKDKVNGMFFPKKNDLVLYLKLKWLLENETAKEVLGQLARQTMVNHFNWEKTVDEIKDTFRKL